MGLFRRSKNRRRSKLKKLRESLTKKSMDAINVVGETVSQLPPETINKLLPVAMKSLRAHKVKVANKKAIKFRNQFLNDNPHLKLQVAINERNRYIDSLVGAGSHAREDEMRARYTSMKAAANGGPIKLQGISNAY